LPEFSFLLFWRETLFASLSVGRARRRGRASCERQETPLVSTSGGRARERE